MHLEIHALKTTVIASRGSQKECSLSMIKSIVGDAADVVGCQQARIPSEEPFTHLIRSVTIKHLVGRPLRIDAEMRHSIDDTIRNRVFAW